MAKAIVMHQTGGPEVLQWENVEPEDEFDNDTLGETFAWENRLDYYIGRMELRLIGRVNNIRGSDQLLTLVQVRRLIGDA